MRLEEQCSPQSPSVEDDKLNWEPKWMSKIPVRWAHFTISPAGVVIMYILPESSMNSSRFEKGKGTTIESTST